MSYLRTGDITAVRAYMQWPDAPITPPLPAGFRWNPDCIEVVNSDATANDPKGRLVRHGGQLDTVICRDTDELTERVTPLALTLAPWPNYRATMTIGVAVPALADDPVLLKKVIEHTRTQLPKAYPIVDPLRPMLAAAPDAAAPDAGAASMRAASIAYTRMITRRHHLLPEHLHRQRMSAGSVGELAAVTRTLAGAAPEAFDVSAAAQGGWVLLRCFPATALPALINSAARFACEWVAAALHGGSGASVADRYRGLLPTQQIFQHALELGWARTNLGSNPRHVVAKRLTQLGHA